MFRKLVSSLPFSPALVGQLGFYVRRLRKEEATRRLGLVFTVLTVIMQSFAVFTPPEQALASTGSSLIDGGISSISQLLSVYDSPSSDYKALMDYVGITRSELASMSSNIVYVCSSDHSWISFGRVSHYSAALGEIKHEVPLPGGGVSVFYSVPLYRFDSVNNSVNCYDSYVGTSAKMGSFSIMRKCGNLQIKKNVEKPPKIESTSKHKSAANLTKKDDAANVVASATDRIEYTVVTTNTGNIETTAPIREELSDVLEYSRVIDTGGGTLDPTTKTLSWGQVKLAVQGTDTRRFVVQLADTIPSTPRAANDPAANNCVMTNTYGNTIEIKVDCTPIKQIESAVKTIPATGPGENIVFGTILVMMVTYFYTRSRQMAKEAVLIRKDYSTGAL